MKKTLIYQEGSGSIRQMPESYLVAHRGRHGGWMSDPDLAADISLCVKVYRTINHSYANRYQATGQQIVDMASKL
jgi:hypothetical protein